MGDIVLVEDHMVEGFASFGYSIEMATQCSEQFYEMSSSVYRSRESCIAMFSFDA